MFRDEIQSELENHIIPFWNDLCDNERGGFYGEMDSVGLKVNKDAPKGVILHSRILWFYSNCYLTLKRRDCLEKAKHCFEFLSKHCVDRENGGVYWMMNADGTVNDPMKHTYCQAFFIYAMSSYYDASGDRAALDLAMEVFDTVETKCVDDVAYLEAQSIDFKPVPNDALSENGLMADKTMNTVLHLIEAYTELYRVSHDQKVLERLKFQLNLTYDKIYDKENSKLLVFFNKNMEVIGDIHSYGHDIEATWLLDRACDMIKDKAITEKISAMNKAIVANIASIAFQNGALNNERDKTEINKTRIWWVQAEGIVGFYNGWQRYGDKMYKLIAEALWLYVKNNIVDPREGGEWYSEVSEQGEFNKSKNEVDPWKCPYHNGRMCMEIIKRAEL
ncbi:MAG: AGE family epimerase/isomerase [Firmicutes bacterium]|nr:AGE family epimerase/isomerase [[Eubacterium] siraeum]MCM1487760.1 AGE family epimerase/isomerase [Bacillota bacterium]